MEPNNHELENKEYDVTAVAEVKSIQNEHIENPNQKRCVTECFC